MERMTASGTSVAANVTGLLSNATGATWTLDANDSADSLAHKITVKGDAATNHSAKTAVITGTNSGGKPQTETINLPNGTATVTSTKYFLTVATVVPSETIGTDTMDIGWAAESITPTMHPKIGGLRIPFNVGFGVIVTSGTPTYTVQHTYDGSNWLDHSSVAGETTSQEGAYTSPVVAIRLKFTAAGGASFTGIQAD